MRTSQAIIVAGLLIAVVVGGAIMWINRYEIAQPFAIGQFQRYDRWTGRVEVCSSIYDEKTYCGANLGRRAAEAREEFQARRKAEGAAVNLTFRTLGYSQEQIDSWPKHVLEQAQFLVSARRSDADVLKFLEEARVSRPKPENKPTAEELLSTAEEVLRPAQ